ncbi:hypothetical protein LLEC1_01619 [Akanthomyces lecanii]|uniref:Beta-lactamase-related domain-containing protein n=1 Tax=Cordyceps confragosa TaxID=2714763 RepID=A0A179IK75_CORDF|nr:hypothetical protein LLEC1_01619 [Akanthomyces lecanii]
MKRYSKLPLVAAALLTSAGLVAAVSGGAQAPLDQHQASSASSDPKSPFTSDFDEYVQQLLDEWKVAGLAIGVVDSKESYTKVSKDACDGRSLVGEATLTLFKAYGYSQLPNMRATTDTLWYVGSTTKAQVAATLAQLIDNQTHVALSQGWQTPISSIIRDDFVVGDEWATAHLTLEDAVSHRTGVAGHIDAYPNTLNGTLATSQDITRLLRHLPLTYEPRTKWDYNNFMYTMLSHTLETLTGEPLRQTLKRVLWEPLGMTSTFLNLKDVTQSKHKIARGYFWNREQQEFGEYPLWDARRHGAVHRPGLHQVARPRMIVPPESYPSQGFDMSLYGLAWFRTTIHGHVVYQHTGSTESHGANVVWLPELNYGLVIFVNQPNEVRHVIARRLIEDRIGTPEADRFDVSGYWKEMLAAAEKAVDNAIDALFPERPTPALPSTHSHGGLVGEYHHPGYGTFQIRLETNPKNQSEDGLVAERDNLAFPTQWRFEHVSGDYWVIWRYSYTDTAKPNAAYAVRIDTAVSGAVESISLQLPETVDGKGPLEIVFVRHG